jgi:hypothetical protein
VTHAPSGIVIVCPFATEAEILRLCSIAEQRLTRLREEPLTGKMVEEILRVTSAERLRSSKDGRMPTAGRAFFGNGRKQVGLFVYSPDVIGELAVRPDQIADWRSRDKNTPALHKETSLTNLGDR